MKVHVLPLINLHCHFRKEVEVAVLSVSKVNLVHTKVPNIISTMLHLEGVALVAIKARK